MEHRRTDRRLNQALDRYVLDVRDLVRQVWRRKFLTLLLIAAPTFLGFVYLVTRPDAYEATASIIVEDNNPNLTDIQNAFPDKKMSATTLDTQAKELASSELMRSVIEKLGLHFDSGNHLVSNTLTNKSAETVQEPKAPEGDATPEEVAAGYRVLNSYAQNLTITPVRGSQVIDITFTAENPFLSAEVANAHAKEHVESQQRQKKEQAEKLNGWVSQQISILKKQSEEKAATAQAFREKNGMVKGRNDDDLIYQQISDIAAQLVPIESRKLELQAQNDALAAAGKNTSLGPIQNSSVIQSLKSQDSAAKQELRGLSAKYGKNHPLYIETQRKVAQIESDLAHETRSIKDTSRNELETITSQEKLLNDRLDELKAQADTLRQNQIQLKTLEQEADASSKLLDSFMSRYQEITSQLDFTHPDARVLELADIPLQPLGAKKPLTMVVILFLSTIFAVGIVFLIGLADRGVHTVDDVKKILQLRMMGVLPDVKNPVAEILNGNRSTYLEEIKRITLHLSGKPSVKTILLTAASSGEGKTSMTLALASYLVSAGRKTVVIDADILTPDVANLAGVKETPGLAEILTGKLEPSSVIQRNERGVSIIAAGSASAGNVDLMRSNNFRNLLDTLKSSYDYVLIDSAPVLDSTDAEAVAALVDQVIMVVAYAKTSKKDLKKAAITLKQFSAEVPSVILNRADLKNVA